MLIGVCVKPPCLVTEYMCGGSLEERLKQPIQFSQQLKILIGVASGMVHLSSLKIIHKDLAARNILLDEHCSPKIADFGLSKIMEQVQSSAATATKQFGPLRWMAPECFTESTFSEASDVWSFGIVCVEVLTQRTPYYDITELAQFVFKFAHGLRPNAYIPNQSPLRDVIERCFRENPSERPNFLQIHAELVKIGQYYLQ